MMVVRALVWPVILQLLVPAADGVPQLDVSEGCRAVARAGLPNDPGEKLYKECLAEENHARSELAKTWSSFKASDRVSCVSGVRGFAPTYTELATCLELKRAVEDIKTKNGKSRPSTTGHGFARPEHS